MPTPEENIALVRAAIEEVWNKNNWSAAAQYYHPDIRVSASPQRERLGLSEFRQLHAMLHAAFPDLSINVDRAFGEGDQVVTRWTTRGTHHGPFMGCPPTGRRFEVMEGAIFRLENGKTRETWFIRNPMGQMQQLGLMPTGPPPRALLLVMRGVGRLGALVSALRSR